MGFEGKLTGFFLISDNRLFFFGKKNKKRYKYYTIIREYITDGEKQCWR